MTGKGEVCIKSLRLTLLLAAILLALSGASLFVGVLPLDSSAAGQIGPMELLLSPGCPDFIFVLDRDATIASEGAKLAQGIMDNELVMRTTAYQNGRVIYLAHPTAWYTAEGGVTALDQMLSDLEAALL